MRYISLRFTYFLTYLLSSVFRANLQQSLFKFVNIVPSRLVYRLYKLQYMFLLSAISQHFDKFNVNQVCTRVFQHKATVSHGSVATHLRCGEIFNDCRINLYCKYPSEYLTEQILEKRPMFDEVISK